MAASGLGVLTTHTNVPVVAETTVQADALHALQILTQSLIQEIRELLASLAVLDITVPVEHPRWDLELLWIVDDSHDLIDLIGCQLASALVQIDVALLADNVRETPSNTLHCGQCKHHLLPPIDVGVAHTQNVLEILRLILDTHGAKSKKNYLGLVVPP